jgi:Ca2+/Na+ antiporter
MRSFIRYYSENRFKIFLGTVQSVVASIYLFPLIKTPQPVRAFDLIYKFASGVENMFHFAINFVNITFTTRFQGIPQNETLLSYIPLFLFLAALVFLVLIVKKQFYWEGVVVTAVLILFYFYAYGTVKLTKYEKLSDLSQKISVTHRNCISGYTQTCGSSYFLCLPLTCTFSLPGVHDYLPENYTGIQIGIELLSKNERLGENNRFVGHSVVYNTPQEIPDEFEVDFKINQQQAFSDLYINSVKITSKINIGNPIIKSFDIHVSEVEMSDKKVWIFRR